MSQHVREEMRRLILAVLPFAVSCSAENPTTKATQPLATKPIPPVQQDTNATLMVDGKERQYAYYIPSNVKSPMPILFCLHGQGGNGNQMMDAFDLKALVAKHGAMLVCPSAIKGKWQDNATASDPTENDLQFFTALIKKLGESGGDPHRVYAVGFSNGGAEVYKLAASLPEQFAAVCGCGASTGYVDVEMDYKTIPVPKRPISVMMVHGVKDPLCGYDMSTFAISLPDAARWWARSIGADPNKPETKTLGKDVARIDKYQAKGEQIALYTYPEAGHEWPIRFNEAAGISINEEMWKFFEGHSRT